MLAYSGHVMTLANSIIGVGILAMPFCFQKCGIVLSVLLLILSNWITRICCHYLIKSSLLTRRRSFEFLGFHAFGASGKLLAELCIIGYLFGTCITYFVVVGDLGPQIIAKMFSLDDGYLHLRTWIMIGVTVVCILPLGMLKNVDSLSAVFTASIGFYVCLVLKIILESEEHIVANDWTNKVIYWRPAGILQCLPIFSMALSCQMQLFEVFESINNQSLEKLNGIVRNATWICTFVYIAVGFFGYVAFCTQAFAGNILMNFSQSFGSDVIKIGFVLSVAFSFPLMIFPCRASIYSLLYRKGHADTTGYIPETRFKVITTCIVGGGLCIALMIPSVELVIGLVGSTIGVAICIMFPAACFRRIVKKESTERSLAQLILVSGFFLMILGTYANLNAIDEQRSGAHLQVPETIAQNVEDNLMRPTEMLPLIKEELLPPIKKKKKLPNPEDEMKSFNALKEKLEKSKQERKQEPLPMDETHEQAIVAKAPSLPEVISPPNKLADKGKNSNFTITQSTPLKPSNNKETPPLNNNTLIKPAPQQQQTIDKDAIKKDEEIAAEEQKNSEKEIKTSNEEELKKTQNELQRTKELLERTVDELKEKLEQQNKETQNLVVEKLGEVVEKVEDLERKVNQELPPPSAPPAVVAAPVVPLVEKPKGDNEKRNNSILGVLTDRAITPKAAKAVPAPGEVYEPLSYKTGELIEHARNGSRLEQRLPLPLALLINASQVKMNETLKQQASVIKDNLETQLNEEKVEAKLKDDKPEKNPTNKENEAPEIKPADPEHKEKGDTEAEQQKIEKENVEAIRRDILQINPTKLQELPSLLPQDEEQALIRNKRETLNLAAIETKIQRENCLTEPKVETLMSHGMSNAIDFKLQGIGRDLKSVKEDQAK